MISRFKMPPRLKVAQDFTTVHGRVIRRRRKQERAQHRERLAEFEREEYERASMIDNYRYS